MNPANALTAARLVAAPIIVWLVARDQLGIAFWLFVVAGLTDIADGYVAKHLNAATTFGRYFDPAADKILLVSVYVSLGLADVIAPWLVALVVVRDLLLVAGALALMASPRSSAPDPLLISKANTLVQIVLAAVALFATGHGFDWPTATDILTVIVAATTVASGLAYLAIVGRRAWAREGGNR